MKAWGMALGAAVCDIRYGRTYVYQVVRDKDVLDSVGFAWNRDAAMWNDVIIPSLETYVDIFGGGKIPQKFVVPSEVPWPEEAWGKNLGYILSDLQSKGTYFGFYGRDIEKLGELGLNQKLSSRAWKKRVAPLLDLYMELHGEEEVPHDFVIPSETPWDEKMWGVRLGLIVARNPQFTPRKC
ncbi:hypothetical protein PR003_g5569 [Phytophthora rubi]|nr:hypothetical protein PR001_g5305 [Phytophthora rubi]KAE9350020.1 hypothetical protein PR003_g5569 [Phytophthora rubi]